jgi:hypothetical protein
MAVKAGDWSASFWIWPYSACAWMGSDKDAGTPWVLANEQRAIPQSGPRCPGCSDN